MSLKRLTSLFLSIVLVLSLASPAFAVGESNEKGVTFSASLDTNELYVSDQDQTIVMTISASSDITVDGIGMRLLFDDGISVTSIDGGSGITGLSTSNYSANTKLLGWTSDVNVSGVTDLVVVTFNIPANTAAGEYTLGVQNVELTSDYGDVWEETASATTTLTISEPAAPAADYEIYYTLDKSDDTDNDEYIEYGVGDTVTASVYIKNNTQKAVSLQAYDIYLTYNGKLTFDSFTASTAGGSVTEKKGSDGVVTHIQAIGTDGSPININLPVYNAEDEDTIIKLGNIKFTVSDDALYMTDMAITLTPGSKDAGDTSTNIGVADYKEDSNTETIGNKTSYYPGVIGDVDGVEVNTTYEVKYYANAGTDAVTGMPTANGVKKHNVAYTIADEPSRTGYTFKGWATSATVAMAEYAAGASYETNKALELYAVWQKNTVTITWMNGETQYGEKDEIEYNAVPTVPSTNPTKANSDNGQYSYTFSHWATLDGTKLTEITGVTEDTTFYAVYTNILRAYTVTWYPQAGGTALESDTNVNWGTKPSYDGEEPTKEQDNTYTYTFAGWATSENQESGTLEENLTGIIGDTAYYAAFSKTERVYTVTFSDGTEAITGGYNASVTLPSTAAAKTGYTFSSWNTVENPTTENPGTSYQPGASYTITGDVTLYAQYTANKYTVIFNKNADDATGSMANQEFTYDVAQKLTANGFTRTGWTFNGWNTVQNPTEEKPGVTYNNEQEVGNLVTSGDITLYAQWTQASYKITKGEEKNGTFTVSKEAANFNESITVTVTPAVGYSIGTVTYTYKNAQGTDVTGNITVTEGAGTFTMPDADVTVNATFTANDYTVTVTSPTNGTVTADKTTGVHYDETITLTVKPATGYKLSTLTYTDASGVAQNVTVSDGAYSFTMPAANTTVTATFVGINYTIKFNSNGGDGYMNNMNAVYGAEYTPSNAFTKTGYTFAGWITTEDGTNPQTTVSNLTTTDGETVTLYAQWTAAEVNYTVNYWLQNVGGGSEQNSTNFTKQDADTVTKTATADSTITVAPEKAYTGFTTPAEKANVTIEADGTTEVDFYYTRNNYTITFKDGDTEYKKESVQYGAAVTAPAAPTKNGYTFKAWSPEVPSTMPAENIDISATWDVVTYNITYKDGDTTLNLTPATYTIVSTDTLPTYSKTNYVFKGWKVTETVEGSTVWAKDAEFSADVETTVNGKYGNVTLTAVWEEAITYAVDDYKYAADGYKMLRIADTLDSGKEYKFNGASMYYLDSTDGEKYLVDDTDTGVFYILIESTYVGTDGKLTEAGMKLITTADATSRTTITYDGDINGDGVVNIADANIVYQMNVYNGSYYTGTNGLTIAQRLGADMSFDTDGTSTHRATIADVNAIVAIINGTSN